jgi:hypothetical protein
VLSPKKEHRYVPWQLLQTVESGMRLSMNHAQCLGSQSALKMNTDQEPLRPLVHSSFGQGKVFVQLKRR